MSTAPTPTTSPLHGTRRPLTWGARAATATLAGAALVLGGGVAQASEAVLKADVAGSVPTDPTIAGVIPGALPWGIDKGTVKVTSSGRVKARVRGLVFTAGDNAGRNTVPTLAASVVCGGAVVATTPTVPYSEAGDARIDAVVALPATCEDPAVLLNPAGITTVYIAYSVPDMED